MNEMEEALKKIADEHLRKKAAEEKRIADSQKAMAQAPSEWEQVLKALRGLSGRDLGGGILCEWSEPGEFGYGDYFARMNHGNSQSNYPENWGEIKIHDRNRLVLRQHSTLTPSIVRSLTSTVSALGVARLATVTSESRVSLPRCLVTANLSCPLS